MANSRFTLDTSSFSVTSFDEAEDEDRDYWLSVDPRTRIAALEQMRQINYGYDPASDRIQRVIEVVQRS